MTYPKVMLGKVANVFTRVMTFEKAGDTELGHTHDYDHVTLLARGSLKINVDGKEATFTAPHLIFIDKNKVHELVALEDNTVACCIHGVRDQTGDIVDPTWIP